MKQIGNMIEVSCGICGKKFLTMRGRNICDKSVEFIQEEMERLKG